MTLPSRFLSSRRIQIATWSILGALLVLLPMLVGESYVFLTSDFLVMALLAVSYNLLFGQTGLLSFGHAAFYGLGAYTVALLGAKVSIGLLPAIFFAPVVAAIAALVIGVFAIRLSGMYLAILTLGFAQIIFTVVSHAYEFTGGDNGLPVVAPDYLLPTTNYYYFTLLIVSASIAVLRMVSASPFGIALRSIRDNAERAAFTGINVKAYQLAAFVVAGAFAGVAGGLRAPLLGMAAPSLLNWNQSATPLLMALAGGVHAFAGPIVGAGIFVFLNFAISLAGTDYSLFIFGVIVLVLVLFVPGGVMGFIEERAGRAMVTWNEPIRRPSAHVAEAGHDAAT